MSATKPVALSFNARTVKPSESEGSVIPIGWYNAIVKDGQLKATKGAKPGSVLNIQYEVLDGEHKGATVWGKFTMENTSAKAVEIGQQDLSAQCHATNIMDVSNDKAFNGAKLQIKVGFEKQSDADLAKYGEKNKVKGWKPLEGAAPAAAYIPTAATATAQPVSALPSAPGVPTVSVTFPPEGWTVHPQDPSYYFKGNEVLTEADLRAKYPAPAPAPVVPATPTAPSVPAAPVALPPPPAALPPAPAPFPPAGWLPHPQAPGYFYQGQEVVDEATLRARSAGPAADSETPPWEQ